MSQTTIETRFFNVVAASRIGDAMGTPTEDLTPAQIESQFGWVTEFEGDGTDDSLMASILADALTKNRGYANADQWATEIHRNRLAILQKRDKFFPSVLHLVEKLDYGYRPADVAFGNMPSTSSAMCIWPVALINAGQPDRAAGQAYELARLIHIGEVDHCTDAAAALAAAIAAAFLPEATIEKCVATGLEVLRPVSSETFRATLQASIDLAQRTPSYERFRTLYQEQHSRPIFCDSLETVPAAFGIALLANGDVKTAVEYGANFGRDTDTIASMAGALTAALAPGLPREWIVQLGDDNVASAQAVAGQLHTTAVERAREQVVIAEHARGLLEESK